MREEVLRLSHVTYQEQGNTPLRDFSLNIFAGEIMGLIPLNCGHSMTALTELLRRNLPLQTVTGWREAHDLQSYQEHGAKEDALRMLFGGHTPEGKFHSDYAMCEMPEAAFLSWLQDPDSFIQTEAETYIKSNPERFLLQFLKDDALLAEYQALMQDTENPIHRMKAITEALKASGAKTVTVTVEKDGKELTFKTAANSLTGHRNYYSTYDIPAQDRREFERLFGRSADYCAEDIIRITYGKKTLYEAPPIQAEDMAERIEMGGMQLG